MDKFVDLLGSILTKLGLATAYIWPKAVLYTLVDAVADSVVLGFIGALFMYGSRLLWQRADYRDKEDYGEEEATAACRIFSWILFFLGPMLVLIAAGCNIATFISPEYATVRDLISAATPKSK